jgi:leader peptidase (prepilin peptidase)/N-methyltransferase
MTEIFSQPLPFTVLAAILGLVVGSFLNVVIHRLPRMMERGWREQCAEFRGEPPGKEEVFNLFLPPSRCPHCGHRIGALENIPVLSWLLLRGRCKGCGQGISPRYPLVEALSGLLSGYAAWHFGPGWQAAGAILFLWAMIALTFIDLDSQLLPDDITLPLLWLGLAFNLGGVFVPLESAVVGAMAGYLSLWLVYWGFKLATGKEGMGFGDFKLLAAIGAWLGWKMLPLTILFSSVVGAVVGIALMIFHRHGRDVPIPFGPYLAGAGILALFWGEAATRAYLGML